MCRIRSFSLSLLVILFLTPLAVPVGPAPPPPPRVDVLFSPEGGCEARIIAEIGRAARSIRVQAYGFTNERIARALIEAHRRGVDCEVILDKSNRTDKFSAGRELHEAGIVCLFDDDHTVANNKVMIIDAATVITGSFNFTRAAEASNAENLLILSGLPDVAKAYVENYAKHRAHARMFDQPPPAGVVDADDSAAVAAGAPQTAGGGASASGKPVMVTGPKAAATVYVTTNGKKYHRAGCEFLRGTGRALNRSEIGSKYTPCSRCRP